MKSNVEQEIRVLGSRLIPRFEKLYSKSTHVKVWLWRNEIKMSLFLSTHVYYFLIWLRSYKDTNTCEVV